MTLPPDGTPPVLLTMTAREFDVCDDGPIGMWREEVCALSTALAEARQEIANTEAVMDENRRVPPRLAEGLTARVRMHLTMSEQVLDALFRRTVQSDARADAAEARLTAMSALFARAREGR